jgi:hypothetical protein
MVAGQRINDAAVSAFVEDAVITIAHNSGFDRKFAERYWPVFEQKAWACSATEVDWRSHGFAGAQLGYLLNGAGYFHQAHRAVDDCHALLEVLHFTLPTTGAPALALLLETARKKTVRVWAEQSPFDLKDSLKRTLATSSELRTGDLRAFHRQAVLALKPNKAAIVLIDTPYRQLVDTLKDYGADLPPTSDPSPRGGSSTPENRKSQPVHRINQRPAGLHVEVPIFDEASPLCSDHVLSSGVRRRSAERGQARSVVACGRYRQYRNRACSLPAARRICRKTLPPELFKQTRNAERVYPATNVSLGGSPGSAQSEDKRCRPCRSDPSTKTAGDHRAGGPSVGP